MSIGEEKWNKWSVKRQASILMRLSCKFICVAYTCVCVCVCVCTDPAIVGEQDGVTLDVSVDDALRVEDGQCLEHRHTHRRYLLLVHPRERERENEKEMDGKRECDEVMLSCFF